LPEHSSTISETINRATDAVREALVDQPLDDFMPLVRNHLPKTMADLAFDRLHDRVPAAYIRSAIASSLASKIVYSEGVNFVRSQPEATLSSIAIKYIEMEKEINVLMTGLEGTDMNKEQKEKIMGLLKKGGVRTGLGIF